MISGNTEPSEMLLVFALVYNVIVKFIDKILNLKKS